MQDRKHRAYTPERQDQDKRLTIRRRQQESHYWLSFFEATQQLEGRLSACDDDIDGASSKAVAVSVDQTVTRKDARGGVELDLKIHTGLTELGRLR